MGFEDFLVWDYWFPPCGQPNILFQFQQTDLVVVVQGLRVISPDLYRLVKRILICLPSCSWSSSLSGVVEGGGGGRGVGSRGGEKEGGGAGCPPLLLSWTGDE